jgi:GR25 family glycosyltransferase involved in LPS biosynthesis
MQAYCINLGRNPERRASAQVEFEREGLNVTFFRATDGKAEAPEDLMITKSEWGCADSHIRVWRDVVENGHEMAMVFEDDISLVPDFNLKLREIMAELPDDWDYVNLGTTDGCHINFRRFSDHLMTGQALNTHAYLISRKCAKKWSDFEPKYLKSQIDVFIMNYPSYNLHVEKPMALQNGDTSTIGTLFTRTFDWTFFINRWKVIVGFLIIFAILCIISKPK